MHPNGADGDAARAREWDSQRYTRPEHCPLLGKVQQHKVGMASLISSLVVEITMGSCPSYATL